VNRELVERAVADLVPYARNARTHSEAQIDQIVASIREFGFTNPILVDGNDIIAGHGRLRAAIKLGLDKVPCLELSGLSEAQKHAYIIADNKLALNAGWDLELLAAELTSLEVSDIDMNAIGFDAAELKELLDDDEDEERYTRKFAAPDYDPSPTCPDIGELCDHAKTSQLVEQIRASTCSEAEKRFLLLAAERHTVFDFRKIADYYSHATPEMQDMMERSALVIIDLRKAIVNGYVNVTQKLMAQYAEDAQAQSPD
jgi:ParB-like nuclease family protein